MSTSTEVDRFLAGQGKSLTGLPLYRLVWSDSAFELRHGVFNDFHGEIFLRTFVGVRNVPKYPYIFHRWILEKYFPAEVAFTEALPDSRNGSYEPLFVFQDKNGNALPVVLKAVEMLVAFDRAENERTAKKRSTESAPLEKAAFERLDAQEFDKILDSIDTSPIQSLLHTKEAIIKP